MEQPLPPAPSHPDRRMELIVGRVLQLGVLVAAGVVVAGAVPFLLRHGAAPADFGTFQAGPAALRSVPGIVRGALALDSRAVLQLGLVLLIATPVARVALSLAAFVLQRDRLYTGMTAVVLALLLYSLMLAPG